VLFASKMPVCYYKCTAMRYSMRVIILIKLNYQSCSENCPFKDPVCALILCRLTIEYGKDLAREVIR